MSLYPVHAQLDARPQTTQHHVTHQDRELGIGPQMPPMPKSELEVNLAAIMAVDMGEDIKQLQHTLDMDKAEGTLHAYSKEHIQLCFQSVRLHVPRRSWTNSSKRLYTKFTRNQTSTNVSSSSTGDQGVCLIKDFDCKASAGEMILILGRPKSGCTSLLRMIANERRDSVELSGTRLYGRTTGSKFAKLHPGDTSFCAAEDIHIPALTVSQTLQFAAGLTDTSDKFVRDSVVSSLLSLLKLSHTTRTMVGDARIRGISGGERKRISLAEALLARAKIMCFDNPTLGLDAGSAAQFIHSLRVLTSTYESIAFVSLYQASDNLFDCFDKVIVMDDGQELFYGHAQSAPRYFMDLGFEMLSGESKADFLTRCVDPRHRDVPDAQYTTHLRNAFKVSQAYTDLRDEVQSMLPPGQTVMRSELIEQEKLSTDQPRWTSTVTHHASFWKQIITLAKRHWWLKSQDWFNLTFKNATALFVALICGSTYWQLPRTSSGAFTRGGIMFIALLFTSFTAFVELPLTMMGRPVTHKQTSLLFYRKSALPLGQMLIDVPITAFENLFFAIVIYFMAGLDRAAGSFFTFYLFIVLSQMCMTVFFRTLGTISRNLDAALRIACVIIVLLILTSGYLVPYGDQRPWIKWFYWLNPVRYAFSGLMINEFKSLTMTCEDAQLVPNGPGYSSLDNQVCTLAGAIAGSDQVSGRSYLEQTFGYQVNNLWLYAGIIIIFVIGLLILNVVLAELISHLPPEVRSQSAVQEQKRGQDDLEKAMHLPSPSTISTSSVPIHWTSLNYTVPLGRATTKKLLHDVSGRCEPGRLLALMGPSGAGKSTLLDVLAQRKRIGSVSGVIRLGGALLEPSLQHEIGYCEQLDVLDPYQTVREALEFSSLLRNHARTPPDERRMYVEEVMELLDLHTCAGRLIGEFPAGLSVDERKRVSIGIELVARPKILFLDEPTSGLDSQSALSIVKFLRKLADAGQPIICTIHQPSAALYHHFDDLLLLHKGRTVFAGPTEAVGQYFSINGFPAPENANIAEFMMQTLTRDDATSLTPEQWQESFNQYSRSKQTGAEQSHLVGVQMIALCETKPGREASHYPTSFYHQLKTVTWKTMLTFTRQPGYFSTRIFNHIVIALLTGLSYLNIGDSYMDVQYRIFVIFQVTILPSLILSQVEPRFEMSRTLFYKDEHSGMYSRTVFVASMVLAEIPISILCATVFFLLLYFPVNFSRVPSQAGYQFLIIYLTEQFSVLLGQTISALTPSSYTASLLTPFLLIVFSLFCGVTIPPPSIPVFWKWLYHLNPLTYLVGGMIETELYNRPVECKGTELSVFDPLPDQSCWQYAAAFLERSSGYLANPNATVACEYCPFTNVEAYAAQFKLSWGQRWRDLGILSVYVFSTLIILYIATVRTNWSSR